jgi:hypothetical protein
MVNYANSVVYKIMSLDPDIDNIFVGSTTAFRKRKHDHKKNCCNESSKEYKRYVYQFIRNNGGWDNWSMVVVKAYPDITSKMELSNKEMKWRKKLKANLNITITNMQELTEEKLKKECRKWQRELDPWYFAREKIKCECGCMIGRSNISNHRKSKKHLTLMND